MPNPTENLEFRHPWRPYQKRVLDAIGIHLRDEKLHIVAAPGSGKTILGLEVFRQLGKPAVILTPTRTIRNQWIARLAMFVPEGSEETPHWASHDLHEPGFLTSVTYQALHTKYREQEEANDREEEDATDPVGDSPSAGELGHTIGLLRKIGVGTLILDEAHHLRQEWWKALSKLVEAIDGLTLVSLTATPPYESIGSEWSRYEELCGPIDEEISIPELVRSGTLCPHQDYVFAVEADPGSAEEIRDYEASLRTLLDDLEPDDELLAAIESHPWVGQRSPDPADVLDEPEVAVAMIVYLHLRKRRLPRALMAILDMEPDEVPLPARRWWQVLIRHYLFGTKWAESEARDEHRRALAGRLRKDGLLHRRELRIEESRPVRESLSLSPSKIDACLRIHDLERRLRGEALRQVILTDFIRDDDGNDERPASVRKLGAWTIFRALAAESPGAEDLGLVTGRLVALPSSRVEQLEEALGEAAGKIQAEPLPGLPGFVRVSGPPLVDAMTDLLTRGALRVMVGTRALLGEGWDAPAINSLVLASYVGSFMLTNQMRGRAIRIDPAVPDKTSSIWHIVAVVPGTESGLSDHADLERRFRTFAGLAAGRPAIESGLDRLAMPDPGGAAWIQSVQTEMGERAERRDELGSRWKEAIESGETGRILPSVRLERPPPIRAFKFRNTLKYLLASALAALLGGCSWLLQGSAGLGNWRYVLGLGLAGALLGLIVALPKLLKALWALIRYLPVDGSIRQISLALLHALRRTDLIETPRRSLRIRVRELDGGGFSVALEGATFYEQSLFADSLEQILGAIRNPRYLVTRPGTGGRRRRIDYHAVPHQLGVNKERAETFLAEWARRIGDGRLIYTRNPEGRAELLKARARAFSSQFVEDVERLDRWQ